MEKEKKKQEEREKREKEEREKAEKEAAEDISKHLYGDLPMVQSTEITNRVWTKVIDLNDTSVGKNVLVRARIQSNRGQGNLVFLVLRDQFSTIQCVAQKSDVISKLMI